MQRMHVAGAIRQEDRYDQTVPKLMALTNVQIVDNVGPPLASTIIKLEDIPEMNYYASEGTGEILVKGPIASKGYFKDPVETEKLIDEDGWLHTGDVGAWTEVRSHLYNDTLIAIIYKHHFQ